MLLKVGPAVGGGGQCYSNKAEGYDPKAGKNWRPPTHMKLALPNYFLIWLILEIYFNRTKVIEYKSWDELSIYFARM